MKLLYRTVAALFALTVRFVRFYPIRTSLVTLLFIALSLSATAYFWWTQQFNQLEILLQEERYRQAETVATRCLSWRSQHIPSLIYLARAQSLQGKHGDAFATLNQIKSLQGGTSTELANEYIYLRAFAGEFDQIEPNLTAMLQQDRTTALRAIDAATLVYFSEMNFSAALNILQYSIKQYPDYYKSFEYLAWMMSLQNQEEKAVELYQQAIERAPNARSPRIRLANLYLLGKKFSEAEAIVSQLKTMADNDHEILTLQAKLLAIQDVPYFQRLKLLQRAHEADPDDYHSTIELARLELEEGNSTRSEELARSLLRRQPHDPEAQYILAISVKKQGRESEAKEEVEKFNLYNQNEQRIRELSRRLIPKDLNNTALIRELAALYHASQRDELAARWYSRVTLIDRNDPESNQYLLNYYLRRGDLQMAERYRRNAVKN